MYVKNIKDIDISTNSFEYIYISKSDMQTKALALYIASMLKKTDVVVLNGELGAGKTTFMQGIAKYFDIENQISSPTFTIVNEYTTKDKNNIYHFDVYRIENSQDFEETIGTEYFENGISIIEWGNIISDILPKKTIYIDISKKEDTNSRSLHIWRKI
ncbi:MAG: tRNA (adenosine(37)-N6)-threonylcarbamoyltransferase complex ATPase subunit type 1 TsaE [Clostridia bacterium]